MDEAYSEIMSVNQEPEKNISFFDGTGKEVLKVTPEGFWVNGRPVEVEDPAEHDRVVYQTLKHLMLGMTAPNPVPISYGNLGDLIEALQILDKYGKHAETNCEHDVLTVHGIDLEKVTEEDKARLDKLGFFVNDEFNNGEQHFTSYRWGSC